MSLTAEDRRTYDADRQRSKTAGTGEVLSFKVARPPWPIPGLKGSAAHWIEVGELLAAGPADLGRRERAAGSLGDFCKTYGSGAFGLPWAGFHRRVLERIEAAVLAGEQTAIVLPRGSGKTTICRFAVLWAILNGLAPYGVLIGATESAGAKGLKAVKTILRFSDALAADYPEACWPVRHLRGEPRRCGSQTINDQPTGVVWAKDQIILPRVPMDVCHPDTPDRFGRPRCSEGIIDVSGITGDIRGRQHVKLDGSIVRPTFAVVDDFQTRRTARSDRDTETRLETINGDVKYLAGPTESVGIAVPCTVIYEGDGADQLVDREENPEWHGEKHRFFESFPPRDKEHEAWWRRWDYYGRMRATAMRNNWEPTKANAYYAKRRALMDRVLVPTWPERYYADKGEISAQQRGMNEYYRDRRAFFSEYQASGDDDHAADDGPAILTPAKVIRSSRTGLPRGTAPDGAAHVVAFIDCHDAMLFWTVAAAAPDFTGGVIDYGTFPENAMPVSLRRASRTIARRYPDLDDDAALAAAVRELAETLARRRWPTVGGADLATGAVLVDDGYKGPVVADALKSSDARGLFWLARGASLGPNNRPMHRYKFDGPAAQTPRGPDPDAPRWMVTREHGFRCIRHDAGHWKGKLHTRFGTPVGNRGRWGLFEPDGVSGDHALFASHLTEQTPHEEDGKYDNVPQTVVVWTAPNNAEDHWLDCGSGAGCGLSVLGCREPKADTAPSISPAATVAPSSTAREEARGGFVTSGRRSSGGWFT